jgi:NTP pyrophosphatase (non-canonical NTP hydrolase)
MPTDPPITATTPAGGQGKPPESGSMTLAELTAAMHEFVGAKGWYDPESPRKQSPRNIATSLVIEAAEVLEHFQWNGQVEDVDALSGELADVALYLLQLASISGIDLQDAILNKLAVNYDRSWD